MNRIEHFPAISSGRAANTVNKLALFAFMRRRFPEAELIGSGVSRSAYRLGRVCAKMAYTEKGLRYNVLERRMFQAGYECFPRIYGSSGKSVIFVEYCAPLSEDDARTALYGYNLNIISCLIETHARLGKERACRLAPADVAGVFSAAETPEAVAGLSERLMSDEGAQGRVLRELVGVCLKHKAFNLHHDFGSARNWGRTERYGESVIIPLDITYV